MQHRARTALRVEPRVLHGFPGSTQADLRIVSELAESGTLEEAVAAHRHVEAGRKRGSLALTVGGSQGIAGATLD